MNLLWKNSSLKENLESEKYLKSTYDSKVARIVAMRLIQLESSPTYADLPKSTGKHSIKEGKKTIYFAVDVPEKGSKGRGKWRLIFEPSGQFDLSNQKTITEIIILGIIDYH